MGVTATAYLTVAIRNYHDSGNTFDMRGCLAELAALFDRLGCYEPAAIIADYAFSPLTAAVPEIGTAIAHLRDVLGDPDLRITLARKGEAMTTAAMATYAYHQINHARTTLEHPS